VQTCRSAGVRALLITGDHPDTAEAVARRVEFSKATLRKRIGCF
jgi:magnesium-transporting ATPase (P-type)